MESALIRRMFMLMAARDYIVDGITKRAQGHFTQLLHLLSQGLMQITTRRTTADRKIETSIRRFLLLFS